LFTYTCSVKDLELLRMPHVYRVHSVCGDAEIVVEMHDDLMFITKSDKLNIEIGISKEKCLQHEFCGKGHVVSVAKLGDKYRVVISIGGFLVVVKNLTEKPELEPVQELYIGLSRIK